MDALLEKAAAAIRRSRFTIAFTGAGISVESGIPPFRGTDGIWSKYDTKVLEINYYRSNPEQCWVYIREIFYDFFAEAKPNHAHLVLAHMEREGFLQSVITQNIDNLHQEAGNKTVREFHGNSKQLVCLKCGRTYSVKEFNMKTIPPLCKDDGSILKPNFVFFGEGIPEEAYAQAFDDANQAEVCLVIGSTGEVYPAAYVPYIAAKRGAVMIEINPERSSFTGQLADIYLRGKATEILGQLERLLME